MMEGIEKAPRSVLVLLSGLFVILLGLVVTNVYASIDTTQKESARNTVRIDYLEKRFDVFDQKLDRIGERVGVRNP